MSTFSTSDILTMIFGIIGIILTIFTIAIMLVVRSVSPEDEDLEQAQAEHVALNPRLSRIITRIVRSVLGPEVCRRLRYHLSVVNNIGDALKASIAKLISITQTVCDIFDLVFHGHQHLEANESNLHISTSAVAEDQHELQVAM